MIRWRSPRGEIPFGTGGRARPEARRWIHLAAVQDTERSVVRLYVDGELVRERTYDGAGGAFAWKAAGHTVIGRGLFDRRFVDPFIGRIDEVYLFQGVLSADSVRAVRDDRYLPQPPARGRAVAPAGGGTITVDLSRPGPRISPLLFGHNLEHTRRAVWQGLSAQLLANRKFAGEVTADAPGDKRIKLGAPGADGVACRWNAVGEGSVEFALDGPPFAGTASQRIKVVAGRGGIGQSGISLGRGREYQLRVWMSVERPQDVVIRMGDSAGETAYVESKVPVAPGDWREATVRFKASRDDTNAALSIVLGTPGTLHVGAASLLPADQFHGMRSDVVALLEQMGVPLLRWPGGNFTRDYRWRDGLLPVDRRPPIAITWSETQPFTDNSDAHEIGTDEFLDLCRRLHATPAITINIDPSVCTPEDAAAWVEYCNGSADTRWGRVRAERGHAEPLRVPYWFVGNEVWGPWMGGVHCSPATYASRLKNYAAAMWKADPKITLIASGAAGIRDWDRTLVAQAGVSFGLLSEHDYAPEGRVHSDRPDDAELGRLLRHTTGSVLTMLQSAHRTARESAPRGRKIDVVLDEWNVWHGWFVNPSANTWRVGPADACYAAGMLNMLAREAAANDVTFATYFQPLQEGAVRIRPLDAELTGVGQVFSLYRVHHDAALLPVNVPRGLGVDACASLQAGKHRVHVTLVPRRGEEGATVPLDLGSLPPETMAMVTTLSAPDMTPDVPLRRASLALRAEGGRFRVPVPRLGVVLVEVPVTP